MKRDQKPIIDLSEIEAALRRAAHDAIHGTREQRSGRFLGASTDWDRWDEQIAKDVEDGKLDKLLDEAKQDYERGNGKEL